MSLDRRRALGSHLFISILIILILYLNSVSYLLWDAEGDALMSFFLSLSLGYSAPFLPLLAAIPFATSFCADWQSGFAHTVSFRAGSKRYLFSKALWCAISGGLALMLGMLMFAVILNAKFPPDFSAEAEAYMGDVSALQTLLLGGGAGAYLSYYAAQAYLAFLSGMLWATSALAFSAFYPNAPLTLCAPLLLYRLLAELGGVVAMPWYLNVTLMEYGQVEQPPATILIAATLLFCGLTAIMSLLFSWRAGRRLRYA